MPGHKVTPPATPGRDDLHPKSLTVASPAIGTPTLTVGEIAEQVSASPEETPAVRERLRHWTREGLMSPVAGHHAGTGKHRQYDPGITYDGAILNALARAGLHIVSRPYLAKALSAARHARQEWELAKERAPLFLEISHTPDVGDAAIAVHKRSVECDPAAELSIVINLDRIFSDVRQRITDGTAAMRATPNRGRTELE
jgi:hypothetical protein